MSSAPIARSLVLGGGVAGLSAAAALSSVSDEIVVIERDAYPSDPRPRHGVPQGGQLHNMLGRAQESLDLLFRGILEQLHAMGCSSATVSTETEVFELGAHMPHRDLGLKLICVEQPTIEHLLRRMLLERGNVTLLERTRVIGLVVSDDSRVGGALVSQEKCSEALIEASIIVDATGAGSGAPQWLEAVGFPRPKETKKHTGHWYVSGVVSRPERSVGDPRFHLTFPTPSISRGALLSPLDDHRWYVSVNGKDSDEPPSTFKQVLDHVAGLGDQGISRAMEGTKLSGQLQRHQRIMTTWRRYDQVEAPLPGFLPLGDSVGALDPLFGQGMSVASWEAVLLRDLLSEPFTPSNQWLERMTKSYHRKVAEAVGTAWDLGTAMERFLSGGPVDVSPDRAQVFAELLRSDPDLHRRYVRMWHLLESGDLLGDDGLIRRMEEMLVAPSHGGAR